MLSEPHVSKEIYEQLVKIVVSDPVFRYMEAYQCPYCRISNKKHYSLSARELVIHLMAVHKEEVIKLVFNLR